MSKRIKPSKKAVKDKVLGGAIDFARQALLDITTLEHIGDHVGMLQEDERLVTHAFDCLLPGYRGWYWVVSLVRVPRAKKALVAELSILPGEDALLAPDWVPWSDRLHPSDIHPSDRMPYNPHDPLLVANVDPGLDQGFESVGVDEDAIALWELGLGRARIMSEQGRSQTYRRWYRSDAGPRNQATRDAKAPCSTCGYLLHMGGSARQLFGVCANEWSAFDGRVVSMDHGCGSHSETDVAYREPLWEQASPVIDDVNIEVAKQ
ncbi:DUF3027 domain-containing protein [Arcanobacterium pinnipediorum]|uniref:DUF3027 domain-containing protein n=1 Tax=Arcanobacterium pinnipediorum TaxID=1503041 RepID=A0ABY5AGC0_9ACTO|nr:DUF3027 domain-containing protein [Arcanobacterium pinnipediorum]USR79248.1 DUF3027 domain-containing protein [Arcanobacterium pinnipediorum]